MNVLAINGRVIATGNEFIDVYSLIDIIKHEKRALDVMGHLGFKPEVSDPSRQRFLTFHCRPTSPVCSLWLTALPSMLLTTLSTTEKHCQLYFHLLVMLPLAISCFSISTISRHPVADTTPSNSLSNRSHRDRSVPSLATSSLLSCSRIRLTRKIKFSRRYNIFTETECL